MLSAPPLKVSWLILYTVFVIYGSLVPLNFHPQDLSWAWGRFLQTPMLKLGETSRADWIANGVLFFPIGFLLIEHFSGERLDRKFSAGLTAIMLVCLLAVGIEFTQLFFPGRTVSQNDIVSEIIGGTLGAFIAFPLSAKVRFIATYKPTQGTQGLTLMLGMYMATYLAYSFFPYDFLLSAKEIAEKFSSNHWGILFAASQHGLGIRTLLTLALEVAATLPFGLFLIRIKSDHERPSAVYLALSGILLGTLIEVVQFFTYSGISQGASILTRTIGVVAGGYLGRNCDLLMHMSLRKQLQRYLGPLTVAYAMALVLFTGWFYRPWGGIQTAISALQVLHFLPFYYHYYVSETNALTSLLSVALLYAPLGVLAWLSSRPKLYSSYLPAVLATLVETGKLFSSTATHADPTNILIAVMAATATASTLDRLLPSGDSQPATGVPRPRQDEQAAPPPVDTQMPATQEASTHNTFSPINALVLGLVAIGCVYWLVDFPVRPLLLAIFLAACSVTVWFRPIAALALIPAALPVLDLAPWSGRFYLDEFDWLLATTLAVGYLRTTGSATTFNPWLKRALILLVISFAISTLRALIPWQAPDANSFNNYFSHFNALRISKGLIWAILFVGLAKRLNIQSEKAFHWFAWGMSIGLAATVALIMREKMMFGGLLNFSSDYRATGPFSEIHTGGAYIECFLAVATPFVIYLTMHARSWLKRVIGILILIATTYALMATVSRNGFAAYAVACALALVTSFAGHERKPRRLIQTTLMAGIILLVALPLYESSFVQQRMSHVSEDLGIRTSHWADGLALRDNDFTTDLFGMGVGRYPDIHYWRSHERFHTSTYSLGNDKGNTFLRIAPGNTIYIEQIVPVEPHQRYRLSMDIRAAKPGNTVGIALCEKWMLASSRCAAWNRSPAIAQPGVWQHFEETLDSRELGSGHWFSKRPIKLSFFTNGVIPVDLDNIRLTDAADTDLIANGDFSQGLDHWFFATDEHLSWHIKSMPLAILFDQGWLGLLAFSAFFMTSLLITGASALRGNHRAGVTFAAVMAFLVVGMFDTLIDAPRFLFLIIVLSNLMSMHSDTPMTKRQKAS